MVARTDKSAYHDDFQDECTKLQSYPNPFMGSPHLIHIPSDVELAALPLSYTTAYTADNWLTEITRNALNLLVSEKELGKGCLYEVVRCV